MREAQHVCSIKDLLAWRGSVIQRAEAVGPTFSQDDGPDVEGLKREITWALDDAVAGFREGSDLPWSPLTWRQLDLELQAASRQGRDTPGWQVLLRADVDELHTMWRRRLEERAPFQYLLATAHWRDLVLAVGPGVLIPRPETELLVDLAAAALAEAPALAAAPWADLGTGSGAIAIGVARVLLKDRQRQAGGHTQGFGPVQQPQQPQQDKQPQQQPQQQPLQQQQQQEARPAGQGSEWQKQQQQGVHAQRQHPQHLQQQQQQHSADPVLVWAVDASPQAAAYARRNAGAHGVGSAVRVVLGPWYAPLQHLRRQLGGIVSNPPYIPRGEMAGLQAEVSRHEPHLALDGGEGSGLDSLTPICEGAADMLLPGGFLALETAGQQQAALAAQLLRDTGFFERVAVLDDCYGVPRFVTATRGS